MRVDLYHAAKNWELMRDIAKHLAEGYPDRSDNWMHWAYALREMDQIEEAKDVALRGLELYPDILSCTTTERANCHCGMSSLRGCLKSDDMCRLGRDAMGRGQRWERGPGPTGPGTSSPPCPPAQINLCDTLHHF
jgi:hypothetical protein